MDGDVDVDGDADVDVDADVEMRGDVGRRPRAGVRLSVRLCVSTCTPVCASVRLCACVCTHACARPAASEASFWMRMSIALRKYSVASAKSLRFCLCVPIELSVSHRSAFVVVPSGIFSKISWASARKAWMMSSSSSVLGLWIIRTTAWYCLILPTCWSGGGGGVCTPWSMGCTVGAWRGARLGYTVDVGCRMRRGDVTQRCDAAM